MTRESLIAGFKLRVLKTQEDYDEARRYWDRVIGDALNQPGTPHYVINYALALTRLMVKFKATQLERWDE